MTISATHPVRWVDLRRELAQQTDLPETTILHVMRKLRESGTVKPVKDVDNKNALMFTEADAAIVTEHALKRANIDKDVSTPEPPAEPEPVEEPEEGERKEVRTAPPANGEPKTIRQLADAPGPPNRAVKEEEGKPEPKKEKKPKSKASTYLLLGGIGLAAVAIFVWWKRRRAAVVRQVEEIERADQPIEPDKKAVVTKWRREFGFE